MIYNYQKEELHKVFKKDSLEYTNMLKIFDYCQEQANNVDFGVQHLIDGGYYDQDIPKQMGGHFKLKDTIFYRLSIDYNGLTVRLFSNNSEVEPSGNDYLRIIYKDILKNWANRKKDINNTIDSLQYFSEQFHKEKEALEKKREQEEKDFQKQMENFEV